MLKDTLTNDEDLITQWLAVRMVAPNSVASYMTTVKQFREFVRKPLPEVTIHDMTRYLGYLQLRYKPATVVTRIGTLRSLFGFAFDMKYVDRNVAVQVQKPNIKSELAEKILTEAEIERLVDAAKRPREKLLIRFAYTTAARSAEIVSVKWSDFKGREEGGQVALFGKHGATRRILLADPLWSDLMNMRELAGGKSTDRVFPRSRTSVWRLIKRTAIRAGLGWAASPHWLRHSHASHSLNNGAPLPLVRDTLGHRCVSSTTKYLHAMPEDSSSSYLKKV